MKITTFRIFNCSHRNHHCLYFVTLVKTDLLDYLSNKKFDLF